MECPANQVAVMKVETKLLKFWNESVIKEYRGFPEEIKDDGGYQLDRIQKGLDADDCEPMDSIGIGAYELRLDNSQNEYRVIYVVKFDDAVWVLHAFQKTTRKTSAKDIALAKGRYEKLLQEKIKEKAAQKKALKKAESGKKS